MSRTVIFIPISRDEHLDRLFTSLELLDCDASTTSLLTYVDGNKALHDRVSQLTEASKFTTRQCIRRKFEKPTNGLHARRRRITAIKNESKRFIGECDYVFGIEDDTIVPTHALTKLLSDYGAYPYAGFIEGVELGRWGVPYVGAWQADDVYEPTKIESAMPPGWFKPYDGKVYEGKRTDEVLSETTAAFTAGVEQGRRSSNVQEIDAGGFYCYLTKRELYMAHEYAPFGHNDLGPDVNYGLYLRQNGYKNYIDWSIKCEHRMRNGSSVSLSSTTPGQVAMVKEGDDWKQIIY